MTTEKLKDKECAILKAARQRFAHYGYSKVTMDEIAADVEMGKASLYYYFPTKENLFQEVIVQEQDEFAEEIEKILVNENCAETPHCARPQPNRGPCRWSSLCRT